MEFSHVRWRKASYSNASGGNCVEVGVWSKASHSTSSSGGCVEVARTAEAVVAVRDSKDPEGPRLAFTADDWRAFLRQVKEGRPGPA